jgi:DHA1 family multidrug resistance protein-like MFS transporter
MAYSVFRGFAISGYQALFSAYMKTVGFSITDIGVAITTSALLAALITPGFGGVIDYYGARIATTFTGLLIVLSLGLLALPKPSLLVFVASYILFMLSFSLGQPARSTLLAQSVPVYSYGYYLGVVTTTFAAARVAGPTISGILVVREGYPRLFALLSSLVLIGVILFHTLSVNIGEKKHTKGLAKVFIESYHRALRPQGRIMRLYPLLVLDRGGWSLWFPLLSAYLKSIGYAEDSIGLFYTIQNITHASTAIVWGKLVDRVGTSRVIVFSEALRVLALASFMLSTSQTVIAIGFALIGSAIAAWIPAYNKLVAQLARERLGEAYANANAVRSLASTPMPSIGGYLSQAIGINTVFILASLLFIVSAMYTSRILTCRRRR